MTYQIKKAEREAIIWAFKSGCYKQGYVRMRESRGVEGTFYDAIGVMFDVLGISWLNPEPSHYVTLMANVGITPSLRNEVMVMNDLQRMSFKDIARWLERNTVPA